MSEFAVGTLFLNRDKEAVETKLNEVGLGYKLRHLNDRWSVFFFEDEYFYQSETTEQLRQVSQTAPVLYFYNAGDHGWGYDFFDQGKVVAAVDVSYEREYYMTQKWAEQRCPGNEAVELMTSREPEGQAAWNAIRDEVLASDEYKQAQIDQFAKANTESFLRFGLTDEQVATLRNLLTVTYQETAGLWDQVDEFKNVLGIEEMRWLNYELVDRDEEEFMHPFR